MFHSRLVSRACMLAGVVGLPAIARADVLTFDDLTTSLTGVRMPESYGPMRWGTGLTDWHHMTSPSNPTNNFLALSGTSTFFGTPIGGPDFLLQSIDVWSRRGLDANGDFCFVLYHDGAVVYNGRVEKNGRQRFSADAQAFTPDYAGPIDGLALAFDNDDWDHLAMDNVRFTLVPAPGAGACGIALILVGMRRRR